MSTHYSPTPRRIEWEGPSGWSVWTDEDGTHIRCPRGTALEMPEAESLFRLWQHARALAAVPIPQPPSREELRAMAAARADQYAKERAVRAIESAFGDDDQAPF